MSSKPYFKLYFSDLAGDTLGLSDAEMGSYLLLLGAMWNAGGALPLEAKSLARIARVTVAKWPKRWTRLKPFFQVSRTSVTHKRLTEERKKVVEISQTMSVNGKAGVEAKRLKSLNSGQAKASGKRKQNASHSIGHIESPQTPQGTSTDLIEWRGPADVRGVARAHLGPSADAYLTRYCAWREVPEKVLAVASATIFAKLKACEADLHEAGWAIRLEREQVA